jgi:hypothetical protein
MTNNKPKEVLQQIELGIKHWGRGEYVQAKASILRDVEPKQVEVSITCTNELGEELLVRSRQCVESLYRVIHDGVITPYIIGLLNEMYREGESKKRGQFTFTSLFGDDSEGE